MPSPFRTVNVAAAAADPTMSSLLVIHRKVARRERLVLEQIGHLQGGFGGTEQDSLPAVGETMEVTSHVRLIGAAGDRCEVTGISTAEVRFPIKSVFQY
jgi:hypothetical protein